MFTARDDHYRESLRQLAEGYAAIIAHYERTISLLEAELARPARSSATSSSVTPSRSGELRILDETLMVEFRGKRCFLGNTVTLRLFRRLLQGRNRFIRHDELLRQVWQGIRAPSTIRSAVKLLRKQLRDAGMKDVANAIDGHVAGHYALIVDRLK
jgi:DNA-binding response OmpR family regulator